MLLDSFEGKSFLGPNKIILDNSQKRLFFTDSGPLGETSIQNPKGSLFLVDLDDMELVQPLALECLAHPSDLAISNNDDILYVCETLKNRILKFYIGNNTLYTFTVFK